MWCDEVGGMGSGGLECYDVGGCCECVCEGVGG